MTIIESAIGCCSSYTPIISPFKTTIFTEVTIFPAQNGQNWRVFASSSTLFYCSWLPSPVSTRGAVLNEQRTKLENHGSGSHDGCHQAGPINCRCHLLCEREKGRERRKKVLHCSYVGCFLLNPSTGSICIYVRETFLYYLTAEDSF